MTTGEAQDGNGPKAPHPAPDPAPAPPVGPLDAGALKALAHPLRMRLLTALRDQGPATATALGARLGESSGAASYHLRQLAAHGLVADAPELGRGRERWWRAVHRSTSFDSEDFVGHPDPEVRGALGVFLMETATKHTQELNTWLGTLHEWPEPWQHHWDMSDFRLRLTPELAGELAYKIHALVESYRGRVAEDAEGSAPVHAHVHLFPRGE